jgi:hypothetical protein
MADSTAFKPSSAEEFETIGTRTCAESSPFESTSPAATLVPPTSTPTQRDLFN